VQRSRCQQVLLRYLREGGFPEVQGADERLRQALLASYVDSTVLRDVIERHDIRQPVALRSLVRQLLTLGGCLSSAHRTDRQRIDPGLIDLFDRRGQRQLGQRLETVVAVELWRRGCSLGYGLTSEREEVDFVARGPDGSVFLVQVCADLQDPATCARELRPLQQLQQASGAKQVDLVVLNPPLGRLELPAGVRLVPAVEWLLEKV